MADIRSYTIGSGRVIFQKLNTNGYRDLGNAPNFAVEQTLEVLDHFNSQSGIRKKDARVITEQELNCTFTLDEPNIDNLALFLLAADPTEATVVGASVTDEAVTARLDKWVQLANHNITASTIVVTGTGGTPTFNEGTDYDVLAAQGWIRALSTGSITEGLALEVDYTHTGVTTNTINAATVTTIEGHVYFLGDPAAGRIIDVFGKVTLEPDGELGLISEEWINFNFTCEFLLDPGTVTGLAELVDRGEVTA